MYVMPKGSQGQKRSADASASCVIGSDRLGEIDEVPIEVRGSIGGRAGAEALSSTKRSEIARLGAKRMARKRNARHEYGR